MLFRADISLIFPRSNVPAPGGKLGSGPVKESVPIILLVWHIAL